ncbi:MAG: hypothetical protein FWB86_11140 [Treponema sp.]|nr:hypothetical protein [Treponema sp.]
MKNTLKFKAMLRIAGIIALALVIGFSMTACDDGGDDGGGGSGSCTHEYVNFVCTKCSQSSWTAVENSPFSSDISTVVYGSDKFVAAGSGGKIAYSTDGITWTAVADSTISTTINDVAYGGGIFIAVGNDGKMASSTDGITWTTLSGNTDIGTNHIRSITYGNGKFVVGSSGARIAYSIDGAVWTTATGTPSGIINVNTIIYGTDKFVAGTNTGNIYYSTDAVSWTVTTPANVTDFGDNSIYSIAHGAFNNGRFVAVGGNGKIAYSNDGTGVWAGQTNPFGIIYIHDVIYANGKYIAVGNLRTMAHSVNGINWTSVTSLPTALPGSFSSIAFGGGKFVVVGASGRIAYSPAN